MWHVGLYGVSFLPAASPKALKEIRQAVRGWSLQTRSDKGLDDLARMFNPYIRGWINYYGHFYKSALYPTLMQIDAFLVRWARCPGDRGGLDKPYYHAAFSADLAASRSLTPIRTAWRKNADSGRAIRRGDGPAPVVQFSSKQKRKTPSERRNLP
jgi:hypothetical protein